MSDVVYKYNAKKNPRGGGFAGVPVGRDLTAADLDGLPDWVIKSIEAADFYEAPKAEPKKSTAKKRAKKEPGNVEDELASEQDNDPAVKVEGG